MDARTLARLLLTVLWLIPATKSLAAPNPQRGVVSPNFVIYAEVPEHAQQISIAAEKYRKKLAKEWLGEEMPQWSDPIPVTVKVGQIGAGGDTRFNFQFYQKTQRYEVHGWNMRVQGSLDLILSSVLPHEITHTVLASYFRCPLPRWADEGASTLCECEEERSRQMRLLKEVMGNRSQYPLHELMSIMEYPQDSHSVYKLYAQGYSLADLLVQMGGRRKFLKFLEDVLSHRRDERFDWNNALKRHYQIQGVQDLDYQWKNWVMAGSPEARDPEQFLAALQPTAKPSRGTARGQSPPEDPFLGTSTVTAGSFPAEPAVAANPAPPARALPESLMQTMDEQPSASAVAESKLEKEQEAEGWELDLVPAFVSESVTTSLAAAEEAQESEVKVTAKTPNRLEGRPTARGSRNPPPPMRTAMTDDGPRSRKNTQPTVVRTPLPTRRLPQSDALPRN